MIKTHEFNSAWWGAPVGIITDTAFFDLDAPERARLLAPYPWVEYKAAAIGDPEFLARATAAGFVCVDTQIRFRVRLETTPAAAPNPPVRFADEARFTVRAEDLKPFRHERFYHLPGITEERVAARYALWANRLAAAHPEWCLELLADDGRTQGWFCAHPGGRVLELTLAMLHRDSQISGLDLYREALAAFAARGARLGAASFSVGNTDVLNLYARLGAHFLPPMGCWLWISPEESVDS